MPALTLPIGSARDRVEGVVCLGGLGPLRVSYEELDDAMVGVKPGILDFLGLDVPDGQVIAPRKPEVLVADPLARC